jgi:uncharacterized protein (DUF58 family)
VNWSWPPTGRSSAAPAGPVLPGPDEGRVRGLAWRIAARLRALLRPPRKLRLTLEGALFLLLVFAVAGAALNTGNNLLYMLCSIMLAMIAVSGVLSENTLRRLEVRRDLPEAFFAGRDGEGRLVVSNPRRVLPSVALAVRERLGRRSDAEASVVHVPLVPPGESAAWPIRYHFRRRGLHRLEALEVETAYPFGLFRKSCRVQAPQDVLVYPELGAGDRALLADRGGLGSREERGTGVDGDFQGLREFVEGEDARLIHWRTSARRGALVAVERSRADRHSSLVVLLPGGDPGDSAIFTVAFEAAVSRAAGAASRLAREGHEVGLLTPSGRLEPRPGDAQLKRILTHLALIEVPERPLTPELAALRQQLGDRDVGVA